MSSDKKLSDTLGRSCPAFSEGCPFASAAAEKQGASRAAADGGPEGGGSSSSVATAAIAAAKCPAFQDGCPFAASKDVNGLGELLKQVPASHLVGGKLYGGPTAALRDIIKQLHERSIAVKEEVGAECPVFSNSCPFKNLTSAGTPLVSELEYRSWSILAPQTTGNADAAPTVDVPPRPLSKDLKEGTRKSHRAAENVHFVRNFIKGRINKDIYKIMVASLWHVYRALEDECRKNCSNPVYGSLHFPTELERVPALEEDLAYYFGSGWRNDKDVVACSACTQEYVDRIRQVGADSPNLLVAHAYTRYLGDLSGGQVLMRVAKKAMQLPADGRGTAFYRFPAMHQSARQFKKQYRLLLDGTKVKPEDADLIVAEANLAFVMNMRCFEELDVLAGDADAVRPLAKVLGTLKMPVSRGQKCPFAHMGGPNPHAKAKTPCHAATRSAAAAQAHAEGAECPFPFILLHDPVRCLQPSYWAKHAQSPVFWVLTALCLAMAYQALFSTRAGEKAIW